MVSLIFLAAVCQIHGTFRYSTTQKMCSQSSSIIAAVHHAGPSPMTFSLSLSQYLPLLPGSLLRTILNRFRRLLSPWRYCSLSAFYVLWCHIHCVTA